MIQTPPGDERLDGMGRECVDVYRCVVGSSEVDRAMIAFEFRFLDTYLFGLSLGLLYIV